MQLVEEHMYIMKGKPSVLRSRSN